MSNEYIPFNPLDRANLARSVANSLLERCATPLADVVAAPFVGAGIYVLYYSGNFPAYAPLASRNRDGWLEAPIYIGKAVPAGSRKGTLDFLSAAPGTALFGRLKEHADSIAAAASTLDLRDFSCRHLFVDDIWIPLGETLLISRYRPIWNLVVEGFGNHDPGRGRHSGKRPKWDVVHPGRAWATRLAEREETADMILAGLGDFFPPV